MSLFLLLFIFSRQQPTIHDDFVVTDKRIKHNYLQYLCTRAQGVSVEIIGIKTFLCFFQTLSLSHKPSLSFFLNFGEHPTLYIKAKQ